MSSYTLKVKRAGLYNSPEYAAIVGTFISAVKSINLT